MQKALLLIVLSLGIFVTSPILAKTINLYAQPTTSSNIITQLKSGDQIMPFFINNNNWVKVANPQNGDVGWVQISELKFTNPTNGSLNGGLSLPTVTQNLDSNQANGEYLNKAMVAEHKISNITRKFTQGYKIFPMPTAILIIVPYDQNGNNTAK